MARVSILFKNHLDLLQTFNRFLPSDHKIEILPNQKIRMITPNWRSDKMDKINFKEVNLILFKLYFIKLTSQLYI